VIWENKLEVLFLLQLLRLAGKGGYVEIEQSVLKTKVVAITAYFGELLNAA
jgi:hypothetical protein